MEAIELDAFRRLHTDDTFWRGLLLGGCCGGQLTTKLYTDRACHFAHHPDSFKDRGLRVHLDQAVAPEWDGESEPVLGLSVPVDRDTLIRRWYVHRIRLDSEGTARRVHIGTEAFARPTEWFGLDECAMTERGLATPAVERIIQARSAPPPSRGSPGKAKKVPKPDARAQGLLRRLLYARRVESVVMVRQVCGEIADLSGASQEIQDQLESAVRHAHIWLEEQAGIRHRLFARLDKAVSDQRPGRCAGS
ncbi:hypothetical protein [Streptomyces durhamensis]|uniref:hypothetical protein n=1 Tax=Streptomyces durhamensis TaxID=68194 RepID=UPI00068ECA1B|nr:hypothetical protein [Streptomyces durhamensis]